MNAPMSAPRIGFAGLTHLGLVSAVAAAAKGFDVVGYDPDPPQVAAHEHAASPIHEPGLSELLAANRGRLTLGSDAAALATCDLVYIAADVETDAEGRSDLEPVRGLAETAAGALARGAALVVLSQVPPGFTRGLAVEPARLYYQVETLVFGRAVERALHPERIIVGCADPGNPLAEPLDQLLGAFECPVVTMRYESAELAKIAINACLAATVGAANVLAEMCEKTGADWSEIVPALRLDARIGAHAYLAPGLGLSGGNIERDLMTILDVAGQTGGDAGVVRAWLADSAYRRDWVLRALHETVLRDTAAPTIAVLGLAYKANTASTRNSPALALIAALGSCTIRAYDPAVDPESVRGGGLVRASTALDACDGADAVAIMTPWDEFAAIEPRELARRLAGRTLLDPCAVLDPVACRAAGLSYRALGRPTI